VLLLAVHSECDSSLRHLKAFAFPQLSIENWPLGVEHLKYYFFPADGHKCNARRSAQICGKPEPLSRAGV
jgi:hypothetical protein